MFGVKLFPVYLSTNIKLLTRGVNLPSNHGNQLLYITHNHATMDICHGIFTKVSTSIIIKMTHDQVSIGLLYSIFPLTAITFCHISTNPMAVPKLLLQDLKKGPKQHLEKNLEKLKYSFLRQQRSKCSNDDL